MNEFILPWMALIIFQQHLVSSLPYLSYQQILAFYNGLSSVHCYVSTSFIDFCLPRSSKWRASLENTLPLSWTKERTWEGLNIDFQPIVPYLLLHPTLASIGALNLQCLGLIHFSSMNYLWLGGFLPYRHVGFWVLCSVKSIFTLSLDFLLQFFFFFLLSMFAFIFCDVSLTLWAIASLFIYFFFILILMEFQEEMGLNISVCHI